MSQPSSFFKHKIALFLVVLMVLTACIPPRQLTQGSKNSFNSTGDFQVQNSLEEQINNLPYAPDPYGQFTVLSKSGHSPIQVITERSVPKNLQVSFEDQVNILPTQLHGHLVRGLQPSEGKLMANVYIEEFEKVFARYSSTLWAEFIKLQQKDQQKSESDHESLLNSLEKGSQAYLEAKTTYQEAKKKQVETFTLQRKILREALNQTKLKQIEALRQRFDKGDFSIQGKCEGGPWWEWLGCSVMTTVQDIGSTIAKAAVTVAQHFGMSPYEIDQLQKNIDLANEISKNEIFDNYVSDNKFVESGYSTPPLEKQKPAQEHKDFGLDLPAIPNASPAAKTLPEQYAEYSTPAEPSDLDPSVSKTLKFLLENNPRLENKTMGAFAAPIFLSDILVGLGVPGAENFFSASAVNCRAKRKQTGISYFTAENMGQIYNQTGDLFNTPCDIAVDSVFFSMDLRLKFMVETINQEMRKQGAIVQYSVDDLRRIFYSDAELIELSKVVKDSRVIDRAKALRGYYEQYLPQFTKNIEVHKNPQTGSNIIEAQLSLTDQNLKDNILAHLNFQGQDSPEDRPTTTLAWLINRVRYYRDKGVYHLSDSQIESIEQFLSNKLASRVFAFRVITPDRCDTNMVNTFRPLGNEESLQQFGSVMVSTSSENFAYDGDYTIELGYYTTNDPKPTPRTPWEAVVRLEKIPAAELMGLSVDDLMHRTDGKKFNPLSVSRFGQKSIIAADDPIPLNTKVAVQVQNKTGNFWDVQIDKVGNPDCKPAYLAVCLPYNESTFQLNHLKYRTGVYRLSTRYSAVKTKKEYDLNWSKNWLINGVDVNKKIYGANLTGYGAPYAYEYVVLHPQYSTFTRVTEAPADIAFSTRYRDPQNFGNVFDGFSTAQYNYLGDRGDESEPALDYVPNLTAPTPQEDGLEVSQEPKAKNGLYEANYSSEAFQQQIQADYKLKKGAKNLLIDLLRPHESNYQYDIFNRTQIDARPQNSFVHVGAIISLRNGDLHNNFELFKRAHIGYSQASVPLKLILKQNDTVLKEWPIDAPIGSDTFVQRYWDGSHEQGKALNTSHPRYQEGQYSVWVTIDESRWLPETEEMYSRLFEAQVYKPVVLDGSSDIHSFNLVGNTEKSLKIFSTQVQSNETIIITGEAPGFSEVEIKSLVPTFDGDLEFSQDNYEINLKENAKFEILIHNYRYTEQYFEKYVFDETTYTLTEPELAVRVSPCATNNLRTQSLEGTCIASNYKIIEDDNLPVYDLNKPLDRNKNGALKIIHTFKKVAKNLNIHDNTFTAARTRIVYAKTIPEVRAALDDFMQSVGQRIRTQAQVDLFVAYTLEPTAKTVVEAIQELYLPPNPQEHPYLFAFEVIMIASGSKWVQKGTLYGYEAIKRSPELAQQILRRIRCGSPFQLTSINSGFRTLSIDPCDITKALKASDAVREATDIAKLNEKLNALPNALKTVLTNNSGFKKASAFVGSFRPKADFMFKTPQSAFKTGFGKLYDYGDNEYKLLRDHLVEKMYKGNKNGDNAATLFKSEDNFKFDGVKVRKSGFYDLDDFSVGDVDFSNMTESIKNRVVDAFENIEKNIKNELINLNNDKYGLKFEKNKDKREWDYRVADTIIAQQFANKGYIREFVNGQWVNKQNASWQDMKNLREQLKLTWHHSEDLKTMQLVPEAIHAANGHIGGTTLATTMNGVTKQEWDTFIGDGKSSPNYYF